MSNFGDHPAGFFGVSGFYNGVATQSLRFNDDDDAYLSRTPSSASNRKTWTYSTWFKIANTSANHTIFSGGSANSGRVALYLSSGGNLITDLGQTGTYDQSVALFRDPSAWYHLVWAFDTTQGTGSNRSRMYINGTEITLTKTRTWAQNTDYQINNNTLHVIGGFANAPAAFSSDKYQAETNFVDGSQLTPSSFGETKNGVWIPIEYTGSYGTNGFRLQFASTTHDAPASEGDAETDNIGADSSGENNHWTASDSIAASDCNMPDSPENNFCTWNPLTIGAQGTLAEGNLKNTAFWSSDLSGNASTFFPESGKWYWELRIDGAGTYPYIGITSQEKTNDTVNGGTFYNIAWRPNGTGVSSGSSLGTITKENIPSFADDAIISFALDVDARKLWVAENNTYADSGDPANGSGENASWTVDVDVSPVIMGYQSQGVGTIANFGQDDTFAGAISSAGNTDGNGKGVFKYAPPSGFLAICTANLPEPTISPNSATQADDYFNTVLYTGNGSTDHNITGVGFQPDFVWLKERSSTSFHQLLDVIRGAGVRLESNVNHAETTPSPVGLSSFDADGFTVENNNGYNQNSQTYVSWNWKAGGTAVSNTDGTITSSVSANTDAGFSIVTYTGNGTSSANYGHGLSSAPELVITKKRSGTDGWAVFGSLLGVNKYLQLETTNAVTTASPYFPLASSSLVNLGATVSGFTNTSSSTYISYVFHSVEGYSKLGTYTGNGSANGPFVFLGLKPSFILIKRTDTAEDWWIYDNKRDTFNPNTQIIYANRSNAEITGTGNNISNDFVSNGIKLRTANVNWNASGGTYIYMAFGDSFKYANAR